MKKTSKRLGMILAAIMLILALLCGFFWFAVPICRPPQEVRAYVLRQIPMSSKWDDVISVAEDKGWEITEAYTDRGLRINDAAGNTAIASEDEMQNGAENPEKVRIVGEKSMYIKLGEYYSPFDTAVFAYLAFDENAALIEVTIRTDVDAL